MFQHEGQGFVRLFTGGRAVSADANAKAKIKLNIPKMDHESVAGILACEPDDTLVLFRGNEDDRTLKPMFPGLDRIVCNNTWENMHKVKLGNLRKTHVLQLKVTQIIPKEGGVFDVTMWVLIEKPTDNYLEVLAERCNREMAVALEQFVEDPPEQTDIEDVTGKPEQPSPEKQSDAFNKDGSVKKKRDHKAERKARKDRKALEEAAAAMGSQLTMGGRQRTFCQINSGRITRTCCR